MDNQTTFYNGNAIIFLEEICLYDLDGKIEDVIRNLEKIKEKYADKNYTRIELSAEIEAYSDRKFYAVNAVRPMTNKEKKEEKEKEEAENKHRIMNMERELKRLKGES